MSAVKIEAKFMKINQLPLFLRKTFEKRLPVQRLVPVTPTGESSVMHKHGHDLLSASSDFV
jgi:hypothetical protein